ncbi:hypothetical protein [Serratia marcescens]|uniref:hypothetical protein n=1 Tax=Serratia marcescens TaxID=615 RepID=UPI0034E8C779
MLHEYFWANEGREKQRRLLAVQAALEVAKASVGKSTSSVQPDQAKFDLKNVSEEIGALADAIQAALDK